MSWQHLNQPQGWIGVISLSLSLSLSRERAREHHRHEVGPWPIRVCRPRRQMAVTAGCLSLLHCQAKAIRTLLSKRHVAMVLLVPGKQTFVTWLQIELLGARDRKVSSQNYYEDRRKNFNDQDATSLEPYHNLSS